MEPNEVSALQDLLMVYAPLVLVALLWSIIWKGLALWHAARRGEWKWFVVLFIVNTLGILELIYLFAIAKIPFGKLFSSDGNRTV